MKFAASVHMAEPMKINHPDKSIVKNLLFYIFRKTDFMEGQWEAIERTLIGKGFHPFTPYGWRKINCVSAGSFSPSGNLPCDRPVDCLDKRSIG